jgi:hypothetical protein
MVFRALAAALAALLVLPLLWRLSQSDAVRSWWSPPVATAKPFQFDNGTVREPAVAASGSTAAVVQGLKKCRVGERLVYTDGPCPKGSAVVPIGGTVNVVAGTRTAVDAASADAPGASASQPRRMRHVREVLDYSSSPSLYDQHVERVTSQVR